MRTHAPFLAAIVTTVIDRIITLAYWHHESNPLVLEIGKGPWLAVTLMLIIGWGYLWHSAEVRAHPAARWMLWAYAVLVGGVTALNLWAVVIPSVV